MRKMLQAGKVAIGFIDGQWGSSGKGKFNSFLANKEHPDFAISHNSVNASHIVVWDNGNEYKFQHLPTSVVNPNTKVIMGAGASIDMDQMLKEMKDWHLTPDRLMIHPNAVVITAEDIMYEKTNLIRIASTMTGNGAAAGRKVMRHPGTRTASNMPDLKPFVGDTYEFALHMLRGGGKGVLETAQGFDLSMDHGMVFENGDHTHKAYPYTTSRNVDPLTFAGMSGLPRHQLGSILLNLRALPIKVGDGSNTKIDGYSGVDMAGSNSGPCWPDQKELTWEEVTAIGNTPFDLKEMTSLTKRVRRVFTFSNMQLKHITRIVQPEFITINFVNYLDHDIAGMKGKMDKAMFKRMYPKVGALVDQVEANQYWAGTPYEAQVVWLGTGPKESEVIELV